MHALLWQNKASSSSFLSKKILAVIEDVLCRPQIRAKFPALADDVIAEFIARIERVAVLVADVPAAISLARDPKDEPYLNTAYACLAENLVTRDKDLLQTGDKVRSRMPKLIIADPVSFLIAVRQQLSAKG